MRKLTLQEQELNFAGECKLINLKYEYKGYTGIEKFAIISELSEEKLNQKYPDIIGRYVPFILLSIKHGEVIAEAHRNDDKFDKRGKRHGILYDINDNEFETHHPEIITDTLEEEVLKNIEVELLYEAIETLEDIQKRRLVSFIFNEMTISEIARLEGVNRNTVSKSINAAIKNLKNYMTSGVK